MGCMSHFFAMIEFIRLDLENNKRKSNDAASINMHALVGKEEK